MKIIHVISGLNNGGAEGVLFRLCSLDRSNTHLVVSLTGEGKYGSLLQSAGVEVFCLNMPAGRLRFSGLMVLYRLIRTEKPAAIQTWMYHADLIGGLVARMAGVSRVFWNIRHSNFVPGESKRSTVFVAKACALLSRWIPEKIICCAQKALEVHAESGYAKRKMVVIANGYNLGAFRVDLDQRNEVRSELAITSQQICIGFVGRFNAQKDHRSLLESLVVIRESGVNVKCLLIGQGLNEDNLQLNGWLRELDVVDDVLLLDQRSDICAIMNSLDLHVMSSSFGEAFPNVLAEAMACGVPCVTTDVGDASLIVSETGWVVEPRNSNALAEAIIGATIEMRDEPQHWENRKVNARIRIEEQFSMTKMLNAYCNVWLGK